MSEISELSHTADVGFRVRAETLEQLFEAAASGLARARGARAARAAGERRTTLELRRPDLERLLVAWLRELLHGAMHHGEVPRPSVHRVWEDDGFALDAEVSWHPVDASGPEREIKGVTYHDLSVDRDPDGWHARVVLDV